MSSKLGIAVGFGVEIGVAVAVRVGVLVGSGVSVSAGPWDAPESLFRVAVGTDATTGVKTGAAGPESPQASGIEMITTASAR